MIFDHLHFLRIRLINTREVEQKGISCSTPMNPDGWWSMILGWKLPDTWIKGSRLMMSPDAWWKNMEYQAKEQNMMSPLSRNN
jgi:hypothetical protein